MNYVTFLPARGVGTAVPEPSWKASAGLEAHAANIQLFDLYHSADFFITLHTLLVGGLSVPLIHIPQCPQ